MRKFAQSVVVCFLAVAFCAVAFGQASDAVGMSDRVVAKVTPASAQHDAVSIGPNVVEIVARHADGKEFYRTRVHNLKTYAAGDFIANALGSNGAQPASAQYLALSTDASAPAAADTSLAGEVTTNGGARHVATYAHTSCSGYPCTWSLTYTWTATGTITNVQKAGVFNAASGGTLVFENTFSAVTLNTNDTLQLTWIITEN